MSTLVPILIALAIQLAPTAEQAIVDLFKLLVAQIPAPDRDFAQTCVSIARDIALDHSDWTQQEQRRYAADAIEQYARDQGRQLDPAIFATLGLSLLDTTKGDS